MKWLLLLLLSCPSMGLFSQHMNQEAINALMKRKDSIIQSNIGAKFPPFKAVTLKGDKLTESSLSGKITIINFWFEGCSPCVAEFEALNELYRTFENNPDFEFISFTLDPPEDAKKTVEKHKLLFKVCPVSREECYRLNLMQGFPTNIITDRLGRMLFIKSGGSIDKEKVSKQVKEFELLIATQLNR